MTLDEFLDAIDNKAPPAPPNQLTSFEAAVGSVLPSDYREFLERCNGGHVGGRLWYKGPTPTGDVADAGVHHIGGFRREPYFSLPRARDGYAGRIPTSLVWIMDDPFGNAICIGVTGIQRGRIYFWDHELEPDSDNWDGRAETAGNVTLIANSFADFVSGLHPNDDDE